MEGVRIFVLSGAGLSAEAGLGTFRDKGGIWKNFNVEEYATPTGFFRNPAKVLDFYSARREGMLKAEPHAGHQALAQLQAAVEDAGGRVTLCTQNIDNLLERAGARSVVHMHGDMERVFCMGCDVRAPWPKKLTPDTRCDACGEVGLTRPNVVWFEEIPYEMDLLATHIAHADLFVSIGTSGAVYPAAMFVAAAAEAGAETMEINLEPSENAALFGARRYGPASEAVPAWVAEVVASL